MPKFQDRRRLPTKYLYNVTLIHGNKEPFGLIFIHIFEHGSMNVFENAGGDPLHYWLSYKQRSENRTSHFDINIWLFMRRKYFVVGLVAPTVTEVRWQGWPQRISHTSLVRLSQVVSMRVIFRWYRIHRAAHQGRLKIFCVEPRLRTLTCRHRASSI